MLRKILRVSAGILPCLAIVFFVYRYLKGKDDDEKGDGSVESSVDFVTTNTTESLLDRGELNGPKIADEELMTSAPIITAEVIPSNIAAEDLRHLVGIFELFHGETVALSRDLGYLVGVRELFPEVIVAPADDLRYLVGVDELFREVPVAPVGDLRYLVGVAELFREATPVPAEDFRYLLGVSELFLEPCPASPENLAHLEGMAELFADETELKVKVAPSLQPKVDRTTEGRYDEGMTGRKAFIGPAAPTAKRGNPNPLKVISGNFAQSTIPRRVHKSRFPNTQCCSIAFTAALRAQVIDPAHWTRETVNRVVVEGDELHTRRIFYLGRSRASTTALTVEELAETVDWEGARYQVKKGPLFYGTLEMDAVLAREFGTKTFEDALNFSVERPFNAALVTMGEYTTAVIRAFSGVYLFDSHRRNRRVIPDAEGTAILAKFRDVAHFVLHTNAKEKPGTLFNVVGIQLTEI